MSNQKKQKQIGDFFSSSNQPKRRAANDDNDDDGDENGFADNTNAKKCKHQVELMLEHVINNNNEINCLLSFDLHFLATSSRPIDFDPGVGTIADVPEIETVAEEFDASTSTSLPPATSQVRMRIEIRTDGKNDDGE